VIGSTRSFGDLLKQLRKRAKMTQGDLAAAVGYSVALICALEQNRRLPDAERVVQSFVPALGLQTEPHLTRQLVELAALARGEHPPALLLQRQTQIVVTNEIAEPALPLPILPTELIGRDQEISTLSRRLLGHGGRLLTLVGPPGIGKTTLALAVATRLTVHYGDGVVFIPLAAVSDANLMAVTIAAAIGSSDASPKPPQVRLIELLRRKTMLLVLDNLEQIPDAAPLIAEIVTNCPGISILATSRERLHLRAEQRYKVPALDLVPAVELFVQRAQVVDDAFQVTPHNQPTLAAICQRLDCLPLALELCAAQVDLFSPAQLLAELQARPLDLLVDGAQDLPSRQRTLRTAIQHSYRLLDSEERQLLRSLGVFVGGFDLAAATTVSGWDQRGAPWATARPLADTLHALLNKNLVRSSTTPAGEPRFLLLETIREFALEQARAHDEAALLRQRHCAAYLQLFRTGDSHLRGPETVAWSVRLQLEQDNLRAALQWALAEARYTDAAWLMVAVSYFWVLCGYGYEEAQWLAQLLPHRQTLAPDLRLAILLTFFRATSILEEFQPIDRWTREVMPLLTDDVDKLLQAFAWFLIAGTISDRTQAAAALEKAIVLAREAPSLGVEFGAIADQEFVLDEYLGWYAAFLLEQGEVASAIPVATERLERSRVRGDLWGVGDGLGLLGRLALLQGDLAQAQRLFQEAVTLATDSNNIVMQCQWQPFLALVTLYGGDATEAQRLLRESLHRALDLKNTGFLARTCTYLAETALWVGEPGQAEQWLGQSLVHQAASQSITMTELQRLWVAARLATAQQQYPSAATLFGVAEQMQSQLHSVHALPMFALADAARATVQTALEPAAFAEAFAAGQQLSLHDALAPIVQVDRLATARSEMGRS
jgi:predicted ATPase/transcriptional regulator with XRE-family HTH domain